MVRRTGSLPTTSILPFTTTTTDESSSNFNRPEPRYTTVPESESESGHDLSESDDCITANDTTSTTPGTGSSPDQISTSNEEVITRRSEVASLLQSPFRRHSGWCLLLLLGTLAVVSVWKTDGIRSQTRTKTATPLAPCTSTSKNGDALSDASSSSSSRTIHYDAATATRPWNPWDLSVMATQNASLLQPQWLWDDSLSETTQKYDANVQSTLGYITSPDIVNGTVVFVSEGELYWTRLLYATAAATTGITAAALKLTRCHPGRVQTPKINPNFPYLIAYVANYQGVPEVYLLDLRRHPSARSGGGAAAQRLTYTDSLYGVTSIVGWKDEGRTLVYAALSMAVSLRDVRMYEIALVQGTNATDMTEAAADWGSSATNGHNSAERLVVLETRPVPLAQAVTGVWGPSPNPLSSSVGNRGNATTAAGANPCLYFVRFQQYSYTARYVGGTAEQLWAYCEGHDTAVPLTTDYAGTSKAPQIWTSPTTNRHFLLLLSDRSEGRHRNNSATTFNSATDSHWVPATLNIWAVPLPTELELYQPPHTVPFLANATFIPLTNAACQFNGWTVREFAVDVVTGRVILRIGADLHWLSTETIEAALTSPPSSFNSIPRPNPFAIQINSDFVEQQERIVEIDLTRHLTDADVLETEFGLTGMLLTVRGQLWVIPATPDASNNFPFMGSGENLPERRYRVIPGALTGGSMRVLQALVVPTSTQSEDRIIWALVLATDPMSPTGELGFFLVEVQPSFVHQFANLGRLPDPFLGGRVNGGSSHGGGLGTVKKGSLVLSPCGRRLAWTDMDDRICTMGMPALSTSGVNDTQTAYRFQCLPTANDEGEPMAGTLSELLFSPGGRYLAVNHKAKNQMRVITIVDCGEPNEAVGDIQVGRSVQITSNRFNSYGMLWGKSRFDALLYATMTAVAKEMGLLKPDDVATTMFFLSDRDIVNDVSSPWGSRAPMPHFRRQAQVFAMPLLPALSTNDETILMGRYAGGGGMELFAGKLSSYEKEALIAMSTASEDNVRRKLHEATLDSLADRNPGRQISPNERALVYRLVAAMIDSSRFPKDADIYFPTNAPIMRDRVYRVTHIPTAEYLTILSQTDDGSLSLIQAASEGTSSLVFFASEPFPGDGVSPIVIPDIGQHGLSTSRRHIFVVTPKGKFTKVVPNTASGIMSFARDSNWNQLKVDTSGLAISVWPVLEYKQMFTDAWRLLRDYFYDPNMHGVDWSTVFSRYEPLVRRCGKREELDDVLAQMTSELSALHTYVYTGESSKPSESLLTPATLAAGFKRHPAWKGFMITEIPEKDPEFNTIDSVPIYSPLSDQALRQTGQRGLRVGDVIVAVNGESVIHAPDINMLLRGSLGRSVRLEVLRLASSVLHNESKWEPEPLITVPIHPQSAYVLRVNSWEWKTRQHAKQLGRDAGFSVGYVHLQSMHSSDEDAFARAFYPDYDADAFIIDVRHNDGGFIDSWLLDALQRKAWMFWSGRGTDRKGDIDWDEQYAFRGKVIVLQDEFTASNAEGFCRGISELGLGRLVGKRTWGGGIWGSSTNNLVDGGIATAPQWGTFNEKFGWGGGVEMTGVSPDIEVDNDPRMAFEGRDSQLERAILELQRWLIDDPIPTFKVPGERPNKSLSSDSCHV